MEHAMDNGFGYTTRPSISSSSMSKKKNLYRVVFMSQGQVYEIYAREVGHGIESALDKSITTRRGATISPIGDRARPSSHPICPV